MINNQLKQCPFCGGEAKLVKRQLKTGFYSSGGTYYVHCTKCLVATQPRKNSEFVINVWNNRYKEHANDIKTEN